MRLIFKTGAASGFRATLLIVAAVIFMISDHHSATFHRYRSKLAAIAVPVQYLVSTPIKTAHWLGASVISQKSLLEENAKLHVHELLLESKLQKLLALERENAQLRGLLKSTTEIAGKVKIAQLLAVDLDPNLQQIVLDKGRHTGVYVGQPVLDAYGVMGQVIDVGPFTSKILLITDRRSAIPVQDNRNGMRAIAIGLGASGKLALINVPDMSNIKVGDTFVASGMGLRFPVGYPVGVVTSIRLISGQHIAMISLAPSAHLDQTQQVLLAWPSKASLLKAVQAQLKKSLPGQKKAEHRVK